MPSSVMIISSWESGVIIVILTSPNLLWSKTAITLDPAFTIARFVNASVMFGGGQSLCKRTTIGGNKHFIRMEVL